MSPRTPHRPTARAAAVLALALAAACAPTTAETSHDDAMARAEDAASESSTLQDYLAARAAEIADLSPQRRAVLDGLVDAVADALSEDGAAELVFICTHNSRRSQMAQVWARVAAERAGVAGVRTFSGGTESTAFHPNAVAALRRAGLTVERGEEVGISVDDNRRYEVSGAPLADPVACWSKTFGDASNPQSGFIAVMTCSDADEACPLVPGAAARVPVTYRDPKVSDGTDAEAATYDERCAQIAREMIHVLDAVAERM